MKRVFLTDRIAVNIIDVDKFKSNYLSVSFVVPFDKRSSAMNELIMKILKRGTKSYSNMIELSKRLEYLYSADIYTKATSFGETQLLSFSIDALDNRYALDNTDILGGAMEVLGEIIFSPLTENGIFFESYFESEKRNQLDDIAAEINNKAKYALGRACEHMFANESYRLSSLGDIETVSSFTNEEIFAQYKSILNSANIEIMFVGHIDEELLKSALMKMLSSYAPCKSLITHTNVVRTVENVKEVHETCIGKQGNLVMGFRTGTVLADGDYPKMALLSELYGGSANSMLFMNVREKMSLCYYCSSIPEAIKGIMFVRAGIENKNFETARDAILAQLDAVKKGNFSDDDLSAAKLSLINAYHEISDNPQSLRNWYTGRILSGITQSPEEAIEEVLKITKNEIVETANKIELDTVYFLEGVQSGGEQ
ncbi:MAG: insulinase family protein [Clostridia bacterium]|nr:insulinase family protein [Clostridia bacterium]